MFTDFDVSIIKIAKELQIDGDLENLTVIKTGNINRTFLGDFKNGDKNTQYIIQMVNGYVFKKPIEIMDNIIAITKYQQKKYAQAGVDCSRLVLDFCSAKDGKFYCFDENGNMWRAYKYITDTVTYDSVPDSKLLTGAGEAFGRFMLSLDDFDMDSLNVTIPDFHNTKARFAVFKKSVEADVCGRADQTREIIEYLLKRESFFSQLVDMQESGVLKTRVTHNDTKYNNVLIDTATGFPQAIIDLDTVMPGLAAYDFGDAIRFCANTSAEDEPDTSKTSLSLEYFDAFAKGYIGAVAKKIDQTELMSLPTGCLMMTLELVMRFLTDYLDGDKYFKIDYPLHNLIRTKCQFALAVDMESKFEKMRDIVKKYSV